MVHASQNMRNIREFRIPIAALGATVISLCSQSAMADMVTFSGNLCAFGEAAQGTEQTRISGFLGRQKYGGPKCGRSGAAERVRVVPMEPG